MRVLALTLMILATSLPTVAVADQAPDEQQLTTWLDEQMQGDDTNDLAYTRRTVNSDGSRVERFDPRREPGEQWELLQENGEEPGTERLAEYREERRESAAEDEAEEEQEDNGDRLVDPATLMLTDETESHWIYSFRPRLEDFEDQLDRVEGRLHVPRDASFVERIEIHNTEEIEPAFMVDIHSFTLMLEFEKLANGQTVIRRTESDVSGKAFGIKNFDETRRQEWSDYEVIEEENDGSEASPADED